MTREEEINNAKEVFYRKILQEGTYYDPRDCFEEGAEWADNHPKSPWISVKDDLPNNPKYLKQPDYSSWVITITENGEVIPAQMIVMHNKTGKLYQLIDDKCQAKINGKWVDAVIYQGADKETGKTKCFVREKSDFDSHFTVVRIVNPNLDDLLMTHRICVLKEIAEEYPGKTIENIIAQLEARRKEISNSATKQ